MRRRRLALAVGLAVLAAAIRAPLLARQGLWADEIFSLATATGHSLEHPAADARPELGDFVEPEGPVPAAELGRYLRHEPGRGPASVVRAVRLSDTSPPLYYLGLWAWTRALGTGDAALRAFSLLAFLASLPFLGALARRVGGPGAVLPALLLFAWNPIAIYYSTEGRHYALLWLCVSASAWLAVSMRARGASAGRLAGFAAAAAAGLLTHYFFLFAWLPLVAWLALSPGRARRARVALAAAAGLALAAPWYARLGESLARWRVTAGWLELEPEGFDRAAAVLALVLGPLGGGDFETWGERRTVARAALLLVAGAAAVALWRARGRAFGGARAGVWAWLAGAWLGPLLFDALQGTYAVAVPRYAIAWLPAGMLLLGGAAAALGPVPRALFLAALCGLWTLQIEVLYAKPTRSWCPLREAAAMVRDAPEEDLVLVHSVPTGLLGVARYLDPGAPVAAWIGQLGTRRVPESIEALTVGRRRVHLLKIHEVGEPAPEEAWLRAHARLDAERRFESARHATFTLPDGAAAHRTAR